MFLKRHTLRMTMWNGWKHAGVLINGCWSITWCVQWWLFVSHSLERFNIRHEICALLGYYAALCRVVSRAQISSTSRRKREIKHKAKRALAVLVAATIVLPKWNVRLYTEARRLFNRGDENVSACSISSATRLSLDGCFYKWNTKQHTGARALTTIASFSVCETNAFCLW
jgi:hypothetical protein